MTSNPLFILLCSGEREKLQMAAKIASLGAVSDRPVEVFVSMNAIQAFARGPVASAGPAAAGAEDAPDAARLFRQGKEFGDLKIWACAMALDVQGWEMENLVEDLFDGALGLTRFISDAEGGQFITV
jgi:peroxiredoxin family protein